MKRQVQSKFCFVPPLATIVHEAKGSNEKLIVHMGRKMG